MASYTNAYEKLYNNMKNTFTVVNDGCESTLGEYMLKRAKEKKNTTILPTAVYQNDSAIAAICSYVNDKLTIKTQPQKDKTIKAFPLRSCAAALLSAVVTCTVVFSYANFISNNDTGAYTIVTEDIEEDAETVQAKDSK